VRPGWQTLEIDGRTFVVRRFTGPIGPALAVELTSDSEGGGALHLRPWTLADHLSALDRHAFHDGHGPRIDPEGLAAEILARTSDPPLHPDTAAALAPLALWWATGGDEADAALPVPMMPWTSLARARALDACTDRDTGALRVGSYLSAMLRASTNDAIDPHTLSGAAAAATLDAVTRINATTNDLSEGPGSEALAHTTLRLCRALGWTPGQVWSAPASEVDRLLALLDRIDRIDAPPPPPPPGPQSARRSGLAAFPDAVIIEVGD
jgi:hypothetical protein